MFLSGLLLQLRASAEFTSRFLKLRMFSEIIFPDDAGFSLLWEGSSGWVTEEGREGRREGWIIVFLKSAVSFILLVSSTFFSDDGLVGVVGEEGAGQGNIGLFSEEWL